MRELVEAAQHALRHAKLYEGLVDGIVGPKTRAAMHAALRAAVLRGAPGSVERLEGERRVVASLQHSLNATGFDAGPVDGFIGPRTRGALAELMHLLEEGKRLELDRADRSTGPGRWPLQRDVEKVFGPAGGPRCTAGRVVLPFPFVIAWDVEKTVLSFSCHEDVAQPLESIFRDASAAYGEQEFRRLRLDRFGGCYNYRKMRGGSRLSMHSWGIAVDIDPERNQLSWGSDRAAFAHRDYKVWWECVEAYGAVSLGKIRDFDWMHFQFARL